MASLLSLRPPNKKVETHAFSKGPRVTLCRLKKKVHLNGAQGTVVYAVRSSESGMDLLGYLLLLILSLANLLICYSVLGQKSRNRFPPKKAMASLLSLRPPNTKVETHAFSKGPRVTLCRLKKKVHLNDVASTCRFIIKLDAASLGDVICVRRVNLLMIHQLLTNGHPRASYRVKDGFNFRCFCQPQTRQDAPGPLATRHCGVVKDWIRTEKNSKIGKSIRRITTGSAQFDEILGGGIESQSITEIFGEFRTGKTQLCHMLCVTSQLGCDIGSGQGKVLYIDTESNFRPKRILSIAERFGLDGDRCLENVIRVRAMTYEQQMEAVIQASALFSESGPFSSIIVDSVMGLFRSEFSGRGELMERQQKLGQHLASLKALAAEHNVACLIVNQCTVYRGAMAIGITSEPRILPIGGHILAHACTTRIHLKKDHDHKSFAKIFDSPSPSGGEAEFIITEGGIMDP